MTSEQIDDIEQFVLSAGGPDRLSHGKRVLHLCRLIAAKESLAFSEDALILAGYLHEVAAYGTHQPEDAANKTQESARLLSTLTRRFGVADDVAEIAGDAIRHYDEDGASQSCECSLIRNANALDQLGYLAIARAFARFPDDMKLAMDDLRKRRDQYAPMIDLNLALVYAKPRLAELDYYISRFEEETFGIY